MKKTLLLLAFLTCISYASISQTTYYFRGAAGNATGGETDWITATNWTRNTDGTSDALGGRTSPASTDVLIIDGAILNSLGNTAKTIYLRMSKDVCGSLTIKGNAIVYFSSFSGGTTDVVAASGITIAAASNAVLNAVTGGTNFTTALKVGDYVSTTGTSASIGQVLSIVSNSAMTVTSDYGLSGTAIYRIPTLSIASNFSLEAGSTMHMGTNVSTTGVTQNLFCLKLESSASGSISGSVLWNRNGSQVRLVAVTSGSLVFQNGSTCTFQVNPVANNMGTSTAGPFLGSALGTGTVGSDFAFNSNSTAISFAKGSTLTMGINNRQYTPFGRGVAATGITVASAVSFQPGSNYTVISGNTFSTGMPYFFSSSSAATYGNIIWNSASMPTNFSASYVDTLLFGSTAGTITSSTGTLNIYGSVINNTTSNHIALGNANFVGTVPQTVSGASTGMVFATNMIVNNASGVTFNNTFNNTYTLNGAVVSGSTTMGVAINYGNIVVPLSVSGTGITTGTTIASITNVSVNATSSSAYTTGTTNVTLTATNASIIPGLGISGTGIASGTYITAVSGATVTLSTPTTGAMVTTSNNIVISGKNLTLSAAATSTSNGSYTFLNVPNIAGDLTVTAGSLTVPASSNIILSSSASHTVNTGSSIVINAGGKFTNTGTITNNGTITVQSSSTASGALINNSTNTIPNVTVQQWITSQRGYRVLSNLFSGNLTPSSSISNTIASVSGANFIKLYNADGTWSSVAGQLVPANTAYAVFLRGLVTDFNGTPGLNNYLNDPTAFAYGVTGTLNGNSVLLNQNNGTATGWTLAGNPFAAPITSSALTGRVSGKSYYLYDVTVNSPSDKKVKSGGWIPVALSSDSKTIPMMGVVAYQAGTSVGNTFTVTSSDINTSGTSASTTLFGESENVKLLELELNKGGSYQDKLFVRADAKASEASSENMDLVKLNNDVTNIYTIAPDKVRLAVDARKGIEASIPVGISAPVGSYTFTVASNNLPNAGNVYLLDKLTNTKTILEAGASYSFEISAAANSKGDERFELGAVKTAIQDVVTNDNFSAKVLGNVVNNAVTLQVKGAKSAVQITVTDLQGKLISSTTSSKEMNNISLVGGSGMYLIKVTDGDASIVNKVVKP